MYNRLLKTLAFTIIFSLSVSSNALAFEDLKFTLGVKSWVAQWDTFTASQNNIQELKKAEESILIPTATIKYKKLFLSSSYYKQDGFAFEPTTFYWYTGTVIENTYAANAERSEFDVTLGYRIIPQVALSIGYKKIDITGNYEVNSYGVAAPGVRGPFISQTTGTFVDNFTGAYLGANFASAFNRYLAGYGTFAYGILDEEYTDSADGFSNSDETSYISAEVGLAYMPAKWVNFTLAYRFQTIESKAKGASWFGIEEGEDRMRGLMLGANVTF